MWPQIARIAPVFICLAILMTSCTSDAPSDQEVLISLTDEVVVPAYQAVASDMAWLDHEVKKLCETPSDASLEDARQAWRTARESWTRSEAMWFGPVMDRRSLSLVDWSPTDASGVDSLLAEQKPITAEAVRNTLSSNRRGFGAVEHILFDNDVLAKLGQSASRCPYLTGLTTVSREETEAILSEWVDGTDSRPAYSDFFTNRSNTALVPNDAVAEVVRTQVFLIRTIVDMRLASALGLRGGGPDLSEIPGNAADSGLPDIRHEVQGMKAVYEGSGQDGLGLSDLVRPLSEEADQRLREQFDSAIKAIDSVQGPLRVAIAERPAQVQAVYDRLADVQRTISTEVVSLLGVSVGFTDTDGDSLR